MFGMFTTIKLLILYNMLLYVEAFAKQRDIHIFITSPIRTFDIFYILYFYGINSICQKWIEIEFDEETLIHLITFIQEGVFVRGSFKDVNNLPANMNISVNSTQNFLRSLWNRFRMDFEMMWSVFWIFYEHRRTPSFKAFQLLFLIWIFISNFIKICCVHLLHGYRKTSRCVSEIALV